MRRTRVTRIGMLTKWDASIHRIRSVKQASWSIAFMSLTLKYRLRLLRTIRL